MKRFLAFFPSFISGFCAQPAFAAKPELLVQQFIEDYQEWNDKALKLSAQLPSGEGIKLAEAAYIELLKKFYLPSFKGQPIAFGTESDHSPRQERIVSSNISIKTAVVTTKSESTVVSNFVADYEYHLIYQPRRWYLEEVYYVDDDGRYAGL
ncbi:hypothetical protein [Rhodoferax saidenbachensis]|uniref:NTF2 fold immunity protein domain-containing protein n=1 Tax=Rhodoferax saidenbachensis TaxID=1484693 RepID=A0ABU1ZS82_9BURK|nr:hypothetical protein [Rhodoferax saidenbachensis]MDR7307411.1 hypothetical protein [Rhodoferax saidenbachensis]